MKKKIWILVECEIETSRKSSEIKDLGGVEILTLPGSKTKIISNDIIDLVHDPRWVRKSYLRGTSGIGVFHERY